jgi:tetrahydromethanopterin S-methyltransferase subunit F
MYGTLANTGVASGGLLGTMVSGVWAGLLVATVILAILTLARLVPRKSA